MTRQRRPRPALRDRSGTAVIEFALTAPLLVLLLLGMFDLAPTLMVRFKLGGATQAVADLATQAATIQVGDISNFFNAGGDVMVPFSSTPLNLRVTNIATDGIGNTFVYWSCASGSLLPNAARSVVSTLPSGLLQITKPLLPGSFVVNGANTSVVLVESTYTYQSPVGLFFPSAQVITNSAYAMPRVSTFIGPTTGAAGYVPTPPIKVANIFNYAFSGLSCSFGY